LSELQVVDRFERRPAKKQCGLTLQNGERCRGTAAHKFPSRKGGEVDVCLECLAEAQGRPTRPVVSSDVGRNDPCPCGSGAKLKKCCRTA